jgi:F0F1-type ATP synthase assembly protein I
MEKIFQPEDRRELLKGWQIHDRKGWRKHDQAARRLEGQYRLIGIASVVFSAIVAASLFAKLEQDYEHYEPWGRIIAGIISITASVLSSLITFNRYEERTERHRVAAVRYKASLKEIEKLLSTGSSSIDDATIHRIEEEFRDLERSAPVVSACIDNAVEKSHDNFGFVSKAEELATQQKPQT